MIQLSLAEARDIAVGAQGLHLLDPVQRVGTEVLGALGCIQLDTIHAVRRSHELVLLARGVDRENASRFLRPAGTVAYFEYWGHAASLIPLNLWPLLSFRRRRNLANGWRGPKVDPAAVEYVRSVVADKGQVTVTDLGGAQ